MTCEIQQSTRVPDINSGERLKGLNILTKSPTLVIEQQGVSGPLDEQYKICACGEWNATRVQRGWLSLSPNYFTSRHI